MGEHPSGCSPSSLWTSFELNGSTTISAVPHDPTNVIAEILGEPANEMRNPANADYQCPFLDSTCTKKSQLLTGPYPVCSVFRAGRRGQRSDRPPVCTCPNRFYEVQIQDDVLREAWIGPAPTNPRVAHEVEMQKFGRVDFVLADFDERRNRVKQFLPVELQAVDNTGSVYPAYMALVNSEQLEERPSYGFNWGNVRKRYISQLITKGYYCHHWGTRIVAVLQTDVFDEFQKHARVASIPLADANIIFMLYQFRWLDTSQRWELALERVVPTNHMMVMNAILYETPPSKDRFESRILQRIHIGGGTPGVETIETIGTIGPNEPDAGEDSE